MSVAPNAGVVDLDTFLPPTAGTDGVQGQVPKPLAGEQDYVLTASGWVALSSLGTLIFQGTWNASTNTPTLASGVGTAGYYYVVSVAGNTDLDGITTWTVGDWALFNGSVWQKIEGGSTVDITGGQINNTVIGGTTPAAGTFTTLTATGQTSLGGAAGSEGFRAYVPVVAGAWLSTRATAAAVFLGNEGTSLPFLVNTNANSFSIRTGSLGGVSEEQLRVTRTASAVNYVQVTGAATGSASTAGVIISAQGSDTTTNIALQGKGSAGGVTLGTGFGINFKAVGFASATVVNNFQAQGSATTVSPVLSAQGTDTNISQVFQSKGTGAIDLAAGSSGINISNGGTVTAITATNSAVVSGYTNIPTITIPAPTTAGGIQAVIVVATMAVAGGSPTIVGGGTGYTVGDVLTVTGGTFTTQTTMTVTTVSAGVITGLNYTTYGVYSVLPSNPVSVTGGTGSGATFTVFYRPNTYTISNAGSGYVEQPSLTFSAPAGGLTQTAYASVGAEPTIKSLFGSTSAGLALSTAYGPQLRLLDIGDGTRPLLVNGGSAGGAQITGITANAILGISASGGNPVSFYTNGRVTTEQFRIAHTASAVNYVQVTGAVTGNAPTISAQGSDATVALTLTSKGAANINFQIGGGTRARVNSDASTDLAISASGGVGFKATGVTSQVNFLQATGAIAGAAPFLSAQGTDTNIDLTLTPKGTGTVKTSGTGIQLVGSTSGYVGLKGVAAAGSTTYTLPAADGTNGQVLSTNGSATLSWATASGGGALAKQTDVFTLADGATYTAPANTQWVKVTCVGSGGGSVGQTSRRATGGGGGAVAIKWLAMTAGQTLTYTLLSGGGATVSSGTLTITTISAGAGGAGTTTAYANSVTYGPAGGTASGGDININGGSGGNSYGSSTTVASNFSGAGGNSPGFGSGGSSVGGTVASASVGTGFGGGGGGSQGIVTNASGAQGVIIFEAY